MSAAPIRSKTATPIDWGAIAPLRLRAQAIAEGLYAGTHRSARKGSGVEFGGHRPYVPGDDLRFFDRRALLRHDRWMIREFETETDRALWVVVDATASMAYRGKTAPSAKVAYAALIAAGLGRVALATGDPVGLGWLGGDGARPLPAMSGREAFERLVGTLESVQAAGDAADDARAMERALGPIARKSRRGAVVVLISDFLDLPSEAEGAFTALASRGRALIGVRVLDRAEAELNFDGHVRLRSMEGPSVTVEADAAVVRAAYQERLAAIAGRWASQLEARGGRFLDATTEEPPAALLKRVVQAIAEARR